MLSAKPLDADSLIAATGFRAQDVMKILLSLELTGLIEQRPGRGFVRKDRDV